VGGAVGVALGAGAMFVRNMVEDRDQAAASSQNAAKREA
jgi:hypothetical protein